MRKRLLAILGATLIAVAAALPAGAITKNYVNDFDHPFVGLVAFYDAAGEFSHRCSGSLLDSSTFLTAGHCTADDSTDDPDDVMAFARIWFQQDAGAGYDAVNDVADPDTGYPVSCGNEPQFCRTATEMYNYGFDGFAGFPDTHDAGIVILSTPLVLSEYGQLPAVGALDALLGTARGQKNATFLASGYGLSYSSPVAVTSFRSRLMAYGKLTNLTSANNAGFNLQTNGNGNGYGGTCSGDSGGPVFWPADSNDIVAVTSFGLNPYCRGVDFSYRVDTQAVQDWIEEVLD